MTEAAKHLLESCFVKFRQFKFGNPFPQKPCTFKERGERFAVRREDGADLCAGSFEEHIGCCICGCDGDGSFFENQICECESAAGDHLFLCRVEEEFVGFGEE